MGFHIRNEINEAFDQILDECKANAENEAVFWEPTPTNNADIEHNHENLSELEEYNENRAVVDLDERSIFENNNIVSQNQHPLSTSLLPSPQQPIPKKRKRNPRQNTTKRYTNMGWLKATLSATSFDSKSIHGKILCGCK